jgi:hypothetical protein
MTICVADSTSFLPITQFSQKIVWDRDFSLLPGLRVESPLILGLNPESIIGPTDVPEFEVHQLLVAQAAFEPDQDADSHVCIGCRQHRPRLF